MSADQKKPRPSPDLARNGLAREYGWKDRDDCSGAVLGYDETRLQQPQAPDDVVALIHVGNPPKPHPNGIDTLIDANPVYLTAEQAVDVALTLLDAAAAGRSKPYGPPEGPVDSDDHERRWQLHVHAASISDLTFWIEEQGDGRFRATEVETGVSGAAAASPREAMENYFDGRFDA